MHFRYYFHVALLAAAAAYPGAGAVELGDAHMRSFIGQPLSADIELTGLASDNATVQAVVSDADVYRGASIAMHPALATANITTFRRDGRRYLHISSSMPMQRDHLPIFFTLNENGQKSVRQVTLWFSPDPNPAPPPPPPLPAPVLAAAPVTAPAPLTVMPPPPPVAAAVPKVVMPRAVPALPFVPTASAVRHPVTLPRVAAAPACATRTVNADDGICAALDTKNAALNAHLAELEDKVKTLSAALQNGVPATVSVGAAATTTVAHAAVVAKPAAVARPLPPKLVPMGSTPAGSTPGAGGGRPWLVIGIVAAIILSLAAGLTMLLLRQRKKKVNLKRKVSELVAADTETAAARPSFIASVKNRLMPGRAARPVAPVETASPETVPAP